MCVGNEADKAFAQMRFTVGSDAPPALDFAGERGEHGCGAERGDGAGWSPTPCNLEPVPAHVQGNEGSMDLDQSARTGGFGALYPRT